MGPQLWGEWGGREGALGVGAAWWGQNLGALGAVGQDLGVGELPGPQQGALWGQEPAGGGRICVPGGGAEASCGGSSWGSPEVLSLSTSLESW